MIIKNLVMKNFFRVYGEVKIECSNTPTSNVTVIKGDNGTGKTTMLSAFHWAFYGEVIEPLVVGEMLNERARAELKEGEYVDSSVQVEISDKGVNYIFLRKLTFKKVNGEVILDGQPEVLITNLSTNPPTPVSKDFFNNIIPKKLSGFFFFDGERIDRLAKIDGKSEIKQAILDLLGLTNIDNISTYLAQIKQDFNRESSKLSQNAETSNLTKELEEVLNKIQSNNTALDKIAEEIKKNKKIREECEQFLKNHNAEELNAKISQAQDKDKGANTYRKSYELAYELEKLNTKIHEFFVDITQEDMDNNLKQVFGLLARKQDREPSLSKNFELQIINKDTKQPQILSTGERQITSLAFIGAMVSYAKDKFNMGLMSDFSGGDYPIVMDSPFGNLDPTHKENVAKGIPALASQVIVIVSDAQWNGIVAESMKDKVGAIYEMTDGYTTVADSEFTEFRREL